MKLPLVAKHKNVVAPKVMTEISRMTSRPDFTLETNVVSGKRKMFCATSTSVTASQAKKLSSCEKL